MEPFWQIANSEWECPSSIIVDGLPQDISLTQALNIVAFGKCGEPHAMNAVVAAAFRCQAQRPLFAAARRGEVRMTGRRASTDRDEAIDPLEFRMPLVAMSGDGNRIGDDLDATTAEEFAKLRNGGSDGTRWTDVTVDRDALLRWLSTVPSALKRRRENARRLVFGDLKPPGPTSSRPLYMSKAEAVLRSGAEFNAKHELAVSLANWLKTEYADFPPAKAETIENALAEIWPDRAAFKSQGPDPEALEV